MLHARSGGETFGLACAEFSILNKPVITCLMGERAHIDILGNKGLYYSNPTELYNILFNFESNRKNLANDLNCYKDYIPEKVMLLFDKIFLT